jgi:hypothetical protein
MGKLNERLSDELDQLRRLRDELRVQLHLGKTEVKQEWDRLEKRWVEVEGRIKHSGEDRIQEIGDSVKELLHDIRQSYDYLRRGRDEQHKSP